MPFYDLYYAIQAFFNAWNVSIPAKSYADSSTESQVGLAQTYEKSDLKYFLDWVKQSWNSLNTYTKRNSFIRTVGSKTNVRNWNGTDADWERYYTDVMNAFQNDVSTSVSTKSVLENGYVGYKLSDLVKSTVTNLTQGMKTGSYTNFSIVTSVSSYYISNVSKLKEVIVNILSKYILTNDAIIYPSGYSSYGGTNEQLQAAIDNNNCHYVNIIMLSSNSLSYVTPFVLVTDKPVHILGYRITNVRQFVTVVKFLNGIGNKAICISLSKDTNSTADNNNCQFHLSEKVNKIYFNTSTENMNADGTGYWCTLYGNFSMYNLTTRTTLMDGYDDHDKTENTILNNAVNDFTAYDIANVNSKVKDGALENDDDRTIIVAPNGVANNREAANNGTIADSIADNLNVIGIDTSTDTPVGTKATDISEAVAIVTNPELPFIVSNPSTPISPTNGNCSLFTIYNPSKESINNVASYLWNSPTDVVDTLKKMFSNPIESIISLALYPFTPSSAYSKLIKIGVFDIENTNSPVVDNIFQTVSCGSIKINEYFNSFLDYSPYTKISMYLPFIGIVNLNADDVIGSTIYVDYKIEMLTGSCLATIKVEKSGINITMYQFEGNCSLQLPITSVNYAQVIKSAISGAAAIGGALLTGGVGGAVIGTVGVANSATSLKAETQRGGNLSGNAGFLGSTIPYIIIERPVTDIPNDFDKLNGIVTNANATIGSLNGFVVVESIDINNIPCTEEEKKQIFTLLNTGIYI